MGKGECCRVTNCKNIITHKGTVCGTHKWRMAKFGSYDLPSYTGIPNTYMEPEKLPDGIVKFCPEHGNLTEDQVYNRFYKLKISSRYCRQCALSANIKRKYKGMSSLNDYNALYEAQQGKCAICHKENTQTRNGVIKRFSIDHCHSSLKIRGLLCQGCNSLLGYAEDSIELLETAINYLKANS